MLAPRPWSPLSGPRLAGGMGLASALLLGCPAAPTLEEGCATCVLGDANNYAWSGELRTSPWTLGAASDATLDWSALSADMYGDPLDPRAGVTEAALLAIPTLSPDEVTDALAADALVQSDVALFVFCTPTEARCRLSDFELFGNGLDVPTYFIEGTGTWLVALLTPASTLATVTLLVPDAASDRHEVVLTPDTTTLTVDVDLGSLTPVVVDPAAALSMDWSGLTRDGLGNPLSAYTLDRLVVARFSGTLDTVEAEAYRVEAAADEVWSMAVSGPTAELAALEGARAFPGVDADSVWILALYCSTCLNPAPRFATRLEPGASPD